MTLPLVAVVLFLQCKGLFPGPLIREPGYGLAPPPGPNKAACGVRYWLPPNWSVNVDESDGECTVGLVAPDWQADEAEADYTIWFRVSKRIGATPWRSDDPGASLPGFAYEDGRWYAASSVRSVPAVKIEGPNWVGLAGDIAYRSHKPEGGYQGVGEGRIAAVIGPDGVLLQAESHGVWSQTTFSEVLCSLEFQGAARGM